MLAFSDFGRAISPALGQAPRGSLVLVACLLSGCSLANFDTLSSQTSSIGGEEDPGVDEPGQGGDTGDADASAGGAPGSGGESDAGSSGGSDQGVADSGVSGSGGSDNPPPEPDPENLVLNPGFENGVSRWMAVGGCAVNVSTGAAHSGTKSLFTSNRNQTWNGPGYNLLNLADAQQAYVAEVWARSEVGGYSLNLTYKYRCAEDTGEGVFVAVGTTYATETWTSITGQFVVPNCSLLESFLYLEGPAITESFYIDDASVTPAP